MTKSKVFGIGLSRTGTTSLTEALSILGYASCHFPSTDDEINANEALTDTSIAVRYKELDLRYPGSKFILTVRNRNDWIKSCEKFWNITEFDEFANYTHELLYYQRYFDKNNFLRAYDNHLLEVYQYFWCREDLLIMNICAGEGWEVLCPFLSRSIPIQPFPFANKGVVAHV